MKTLPNRKPRSEELLVLALLTTSLVATSLQRVMSEGLWLVLIVVSVVCLAASGIAAERHNRKWFLVSALAILLFCALLLNRFG